MDINDISKIAKDALVKIGHHSPQMVAEVVDNGKKGLAIMLLLLTMHSSKRKQKK